ncbi:MAG: M48 family metallopeptidase [Bacteroidetes bacterium]|nr:M48 family metallopeptidase [Bacteroidota bacterium]
MKKVLFQLLLTVALFFLIWFSLSRINWKFILSIEQATKTTEEKLGDLFWKVYKTSETEIRRKKIIAPIDTLLSFICTKNHIERNGIKLHIIMKDEINAYTLPDRHLVVFSGLINACENESELCGILGHELAHMEKNHVMKKLIKEVGLSALISFTTGNKAGSQAAKELAKTLSSTGYDRTLEREADLASVDYLLNANIDPEPFATFLFRIAKETGNLPKQLFWLSTHPDSEERAEKIIETIKNKKITKKNILYPETWKSLSLLLNEEE